MTYSTFNYYLSNGNYRLPFPFESHAAAEAYNAALGGGYTVVEVAERVMSGDDFEELELDRAVEDEIERENNKYGEVWGE